MKRKNTSRSTRRQRRFLNYEILEPRQLLAGDLAAIHQASFELPTDANMVQNGDFELVSGPNGFFEDTAVDGWSAKDSANGQQLNFFNYSDDYTMVLDLDSTVAHYDSILQDIDTTFESQYVLSFDFRAHPSLNPDPTARSYDFEVLWGGQLVGEYTGGDFWQTGALLVAGGDGDSTELEFREIAEGVVGGGDGLGPLLDNIRVVEASEMQIVNGSFEATVDDKLQFFHHSEVDGWGAIGADDANLLIKIEDSTIGAAASATDGENYLNLDTTLTQRDVVFQDFQTVAGATYYVTFDLRVDGPQTDSSDELRVRWNNDWATTIHADLDWQRYGLVLEADSESTQLVFLEPGDGNHGEGSGPLIDDIRVFEVVPQNVNEAPEIEQITNQTADFGKPVTYNVVASDPEEQPLTYEIEYSGIGAIHNKPTISQDGEISWTPSDSGLAELLVTVTDSLGLTDQMDFSVDVGEFVPFEGEGVLANIPPEARNGIYSEKPAITIDTTKNFEARFTTTEGMFSIDLYASQAPETVNNFVLLAGDGYYNGIDFHRVIDGFMGQSGDPLGTGGGGPGYSFGDETDNGLVFDEPNLLAMANRGPDTNGSQFFITFGTPTHLNGSHTIFGKISGDDSAFLSSTVTHTVVGNQEIPISGIDKTIIESITIHVS